MLGNICLCGINGNLKSLHSTNTNKKQQGLMHCKYELQILYCTPPHAVDLTLIKSCGMNINSADN